MKGARKRRFKTTVADGQRRRDGLGRVWHEELGWVEPHTYERVTCVEGLLRRSADCQTEMPWE